MAHDMIDRGAKRVAVAAIAETSGRRAMVKNILKGETVEFCRRHARGEFGYKQVEHFGRQTACAAHAGEIFRSVKRNYIRRGPWAVDELRNIGVRTGHDHNLGIFGVMPSHQTVAGQGPFRMTNENLPTAAVLL